MAPGAPYWASNCRTDSDCIIDDFEMVSREMKPDDSPPGDFPKNKNAPLPGLPAGAPKGELTKKQLGNIEITYYSTAIIRGMMESGIDYFITLKNNGNSEAAVHLSPDEELVKQTPKWNLHFYSFQDSPVKIKPGEEKKLWYFISMDKGDGEQFTVRFRLWLDSANQAELPVIFGAVGDDLRGRETGIIYGYVKDENGMPVNRVRVDATMNCGRSGFRGDTDESGRYAIPILAMEDIRAIYDRETACDSNDYFVSIIADGYELYFKEHVAPTREKYEMLNITLEKAEESASYQLKWEKRVDEPYGFFWVKASDDFSVFAADQAKHPPELGKPTSFYLFDSDGNVLLKQPVDNECWGIDIAKDGSKVTAGCHDKKVYAAGKSRLLWEFDTGGMVRSACFSADGTKILSGAIGKLYFFNSDSGSKKEIPWIDEWFRNCKFYNDDSGFVVGARTLAGFDSSSNKKWEFVMGEFPMFLGVDNSNNVYAAGKSRTLFSFDADGSLRWKHRIPDHVAGAGDVTPDGSRVVVGTVGAMIYLFDGDGNLLWKRPMAGVGIEGGMGHNAVAISDDGKRIIVGGAPSNCVFVYNEKGTLLWKGCNEIADVPEDMMPGINSVQISKDKNEIVAAYGDNYIREFIGE